MKLNHQTESVETFGVTQQSSFTIKASAKAFSILSDGLYSDKIRAIIRELACNAYDAHVDAGHPERPFDIQFPNSIVPEYIIRDYGTGLSYDDIMHLFTTYFESTKTGSNDLIGALGLGSKSPFSYTKSFTVISYFRGKKMTFTAFIGADGTPQCAHMFTEPTTEEVGLEVRFGVKEGDHRTFADRAHKVFRYFKTIPNVKGIEFNLKLDDRKKSILAEGNEWRLYKCHQNYSDTTAIQGNIGYPIKVNSITFTDDEMPVKKFLESLNGNLEIDFDIGELQFAASREELGYDDITQSNIKARCSLILKEFAAKATADLSSATTLWEAHSTMYNIKQTYGQNIVESLSGKFAPEWRGIGITNHRIAVDLISFSKEQGYHGWHNYYDQDVPDALPLIVSMFGPPADGYSNTGRWRKQTRTDYRSNYNISNKSADWYNNEVSFDPHQKPVVLIDDVKKRGIYKRINDAFSDKDWRENNNITKKQVLLFEFENAKDEKAFLKKLGDPVPMYVSSLPKALKNRTRLDQVMFKYDPSYNDVRSRWENDPDVVLEDGGIYVAIKGFVPYKTNPDTMTKFQKWDNFKFSKLVKDAVLLGIIKDTNVIKGIRNAHIKEYKIEENPAWIEVGDYFKIEVLKKLKWTGLGKKIAYGNNNDLGARHNYINNLDVHNKNWLHLNEKTELRQFIEKIKNIKNVEPKVRIPKAWQITELTKYSYNTWPEILTRMALVVDLDVKEHFQHKGYSLDDEYDQIALKYPLVTAIEWDSWRMGRVDLDDSAPKIGDEDININAVMAWQTWHAVVQLKD